MRHNILFTGMGYPLGIFHLTHFVVYDGRGERGVVLS